MLKNYGFGLNKSLAGSSEQYAKVYVQDGKIITPTQTLSAFALKMAAPFGAKLECKYVQVRSAGNGRIHAQLADSPTNRPYGASWNFTDWDLTAYLTGETKPAPKPVYAPAPKPEPQTVGDLFVLFGVATAPAPTVSAPAPKPTVAAPKATVTPTNFGKVTSQAGTGKEYTLVFVQDHKIITPAGVIDGTALLNACAKAGGNADRKFVQVRRNAPVGPGYLASIHAQLPDEGGNRKYGTSFDFADNALFELLG